MPGSESGEAAKPSGLFGRFFNKGKSPIRAKLGDDNKYVYNEKLKKWIGPGESIEEAAAASAPPPMSRVSSAGSVGSNAEKRGAVPRYAAAGLAAPKPGGPDASSTSSAAFLPSPAKPPLGPPSKPAFFLPGAPSDGSTGAAPSGNFFMPSTGSAGQGAARFSGYRSPASQAKRSPSGSQGVAPEDDHASKRSKALTPGEEPSSATADSSVTLAHGIAAVPALSSEVTLARGMGDAAGQTGFAPAMQSVHGEESVGENTFGSTTADDAGEGVTSPGLKVDRLVGGNAYADPEAGSNAQASWAGAAMGSGLDDEPRLGAPDAAAQAATPAEAVVEADAEASGTPQRTDIDWYREIQSFYDASLQQGYSAGETQNWLREGYPTLMEGFLSWYQANKEGSVQERASRLSTDTAGTVQSQGAEPASAAAMAESAEAPGAPDMGVTDLALEHKYAQEMGKPLPGHQNIVHQNTGPDGRTHGRMLSEIRSDVADHGSIISDRDDTQKTGIAGGRATESTASGKLTGPLPWDILDDLSDDDGLSTATGTPRHFDVILSNGEPALVDNRNPSRPALAGAALAEAAEQAGGRIAGWVTDFVKSGAIQQAVQQLPGAVAAQSRFPRPPPDIKNLFSHSPRSVHSAGTSMVANAGTPSSIKSVPTDSQHFEAQGMPHSARAAQSNRAAKQHSYPALVEEQALPEDPMDDAPPEQMSRNAPAAFPGPQECESKTPDEGAALEGKLGDHLSDQPQQDITGEAMAEDGWEFGDSALEGLGDVQPSQGRSGAGHAPPAGGSSAIGIQSKPEDAYGNGSVAGMSPPGGGWESELNFPLDDIPKEPKSALSSQGGEMDLPEGGKLKKLVVPPASPLRPLGSGAQPDSSAALHEAMAHGDTNEKLAALQLRLEEVTAMHQQATDENESLRDQNGALEMELNDLKSQLDRDILETRQLQEKMIDQRRIEEQLEEMMQELEDLRIKYDALKADNSTLLAERKSESASSPAGHAAADANGDAGPHAALEAARNAAALPLASAQLEAELAEARDKSAAAEERMAELQENVEQLMTELDESMQEVVSRDEEIDQLVARLKDTQDAAEKLQHLERDANAANQEVVQLADELEKRDDRVEQLQEELEGLRQLTRQHEERLAGRDAELKQLQVQLENTGLDTGRIADLEAELAAAMSQVAAKALEADGLRKEVEGAKAAAEIEAELKLQLEVQQSLAQDAQQQVQALRHELNTLQEAAASEQQARSEAESQLKAVRESAQLDFERIGALSEENAKLQDQVEELKASREAAASAELQELQSAQEAAQASLAQAGANITALTAEKDNLAKRGSKLQAKFTKLQAESAKKQEQAAAQLAELQQKLDNALAASPGADSAALQEALDKVAVLAQRAAEAEAREAEASTRVEEAERQVAAAGLRAEEAEGQLAAAGSRAEEAEQAAAEAREMAEAAERQRADAASLAEAQQTEAAAKAERRVEEAGSRAREASEQLEQAQARSEALERQLAQESELRSTAEQRAADEEATRAALEADAGAQGTKVSELEEEASSLFERVSGLEEELGAAQAQSHSHAQALAAAQAEIMELKEKLAATPAPAAAPVEDDDMENLMSALGQESEKVDRLVELLQQRGFDPTGVLDEIEERYALGDDAEDEDISSPSVASQPAEGSEAAVQLHSNAAFDDRHDRDVPHTGSHQGAGAALTEHPRVPKTRQAGLKTFGEEMQHQTEDPKQPETDEQQEKGRGRGGWGDEPSNTAENRIEGLPEGELLSPPQLPQGKPEQLAAQIDFGQAGAAGDGWDAWDEDIGSSFA